MLQTTLSYLGNIDIYLLDQVMKNRYLPGERLLDAGVGGGRNLHWFSQGDYDLYGVDTNPDAIAVLKEKYPDWSPKKLQVAGLDALPFPDAFFHHIICSAVLHFSESPAHFLQMLGEMVRVLKPGGSLFIRMASEMGIEPFIEPLGNGVYNLPDGTQRFLLTRPLLKTLLENFPIEFAEPVKTVNVEDMRCMTTLVFIKSGCTIMVK
jgi:ubiquinone/menaquinone biosynthesis C-methylase UbiE